MANKVTYAATAWKDGSDGGTAITAARLNNIEGGISALATQGNALCDSMSGVESRLGNAEKAAASSGPTALSAATTYIDTSTGGVVAWRRGLVAGLSGEIKLKSTLPNGKSTSIGTVPSGMRPPSGMTLGEVLGAFVVQGTAVSLMVRVKSTGEATLDNNSGSDVPPGWAVGSLTWPI